MGAGSCMTLAKGQCASLVCLGAFRADFPAFYLVHLVEARAGPGKRVVTRFGTELTSANGEGCLQAPMIGKKAPE